MTIRQELAEFCISLKFEDLPASVVRSARVCLMDQMSLVIGRGPTFAEDNPDIATVYREMGGRPESSALGIGGKIPCLHAAQINAYVGTDTGMDAIHENTIIHLPAALVPATVAVAETQKQSGRELILAIVAGAEVMARIGLALGVKQTYARGFHPSSIAAPFGCAAAAGRLLGLSTDEIAEALSVAESQAAGSGMFGGEIHPTSWYFQIGRGAQSGVLSAMLAGAGMTGPELIFEDPLGFLAGYSDQADQGQLTADLGSRWEIKNLILKKYGVGLYLFTTIETLERMLQEYRLVAGDIASMTLELPNTVIPKVGFPAFPINRGATRISGRYILATTAHLPGRMAYSMEFSDLSQRNDPDVIDLFGRTRVLPNPELDRIFPAKQACILTIKTKDGREFRQRNDGPFQGDATHPLTEADIETKFQRLVAPVLGQATTDRLRDGLRQIENAADVSPLIEMALP